MRPVGGAGLVTTAFDSNPSGLVPTTITQLGPNLIELTYGASIAADTFLDYDGTTPGLVKQQFGIPFN
jgi:hypothetical protein